jgi:hypothetical protein
MAQSLHTFTLVGPGDAEINDIVGPGCVTAGPILPAVRIVAMIEDSVLNDVKEEYRRRQWAWVGEGDLREPV